MRGEIWRPILRGVKITGFLLAIILSSSVITIQSSRPAKAESLLYTVGCAVKVLLNKDCSQKTKPQPNNPSEPTPGGDPDPSPNPGSPDEEPVGPGSGSMTPQKPLKLDKSQLTKLPPIRDLSSPVLGSGSGLTANVLPAIRGTGGNRAVLGASDIAPLQATDQGWKILGVFWYWWLVAGLGILVLGLILKATLLKSILAVAK